MTLGLELYRLRELECLRRRLRGRNPKKKLTQLTKLTSIHGDKTPFGPEGAKARAALTLGLDIY